MLPGQEVKGGKAVPVATVGKVIRLLDRPVLPLIHFLVHLVPVDIGGLTGKMVKLYKAYERNVHSDAQKDFYIRK